MLDTDPQPADDLLDGMPADDDRHVENTPGSHTVGDSGTDQPSLALFSGDDGTLSLEQRRALVCLLRNKFVSAAGNPAEWRVIREHNHLIKSRLNDMFLDLHLDLPHEVAFKRKVVSDASNDFPTLLKDTSYTREETILLAFLRLRYRTEQQAGHDDVTIERSELLEHVKTYRPPHATDRSRDNARAEKAVDSLIAAKVLTRTNDPGRLRVSSVIAVLLPLARLAELHEWLIAKNGSPQAGIEGRADITSDDDIGEDVEDPDEVMDVEVSA